MKSLFLVFCFFFILSNHLYSQEGWILSNPSPTIDNIADVFCVDSQVVLLLSEKGELFKSIDGGNTWELKLKMLHGIGMDFYDNSGIVIGWRDEVYRSFDYGETWNKIDVGFNTFYAEPFLSVQYTSKDTIYMPTFLGYTCVSYNGGNTWGFFGDADVKAIDNMHFVSSTTGFCSHNNELYKTIDGGINWSVLYSKGSDGSYLLGFINEKIGFMSSYFDETYRTIDGGLTWQQVLNVRAVDMEIVNDTIAYLFSHFIEGKVFKTTDAGQTWIEVFNISDFKDNNFNYLDFCTESFGICFGERGHFFRTTNGAETWESLYSIDGDISGIHFSIDSIGYGVSSSGQFFRSANFGKSWKFLFEKIDTVLNDVWFVHPDTGFIVGDNLLLMRTTDGGNHFTPVNLSLLNLQDDISFQKIKFIDNKVGFISSTSSFLKTIDGGISWVKLSGYSLRDFQFVTPQIAFAINWSGMAIYQTSDGGIEWHSIFETSEEIKSVCFTSKDTGYICGEGFAKKTLDGGENWQDISVDGQNLYYNHICFPVSEVGYLCANNGIYKTIDNGETWYSENLNFDYGELNSFFINSDLSQIYLTGKKGLIYRNKVSNEILSTDLGDSFVKPNNYVYPNPTSGILFISDISVPIIEIELFSLKGVKVLHVLNPNKQLNLSHLHNGIYFVKIHTKETCFTSKVIKY